MPNILYKYSRDSGWKWHFRYCTKKFVTHLQKDTWHTVQKFILNMSILTPKTLHKSLLTRFKMTCRIVYKTSCDMRPNWYVAHRTNFLARRNFLRNVSSLRCGTLYKTYCGTFSNRHVALSITYISTLVGNERRHTVQNVLWHVSKLTRGILYKISCKPDIFKYVLTSTVHCMKSLFRAAPFPVFVWRRCNAQQCTVGTLYCTRAHVINA